MRTPPTETAERVWLDMIRRAARKKAIERTSAKTRQMAPRQDGKAVRREG